MSEREDKGRKGGGGLWLEEFSPVCSGLADLAVEVVEFCNEFLLPLLWRKMAEVWPGLHLQHTHTHTHTSTTDTAGTTVPLAETLHYITVGSHYVYVNTRSEL